MLALVALFLVTIITSASAVWVYRKLSTWHGFTETLVGRPHATTRMKIGAQQGFISLGSKQGGYIGYIGYIETPWGW